MKIVQAIQYYFSLGLIAAFCILGVVMTFDVPPFQVADEDLHWVVALDRAETLIATVRGREASKCATGVTLPDHFEVGGLKNLTTLMPAHKYQTLPRVPSSCNTRPDISYGTILTYPGVILGRLLISDEVVNSERALAVFYLGRIVPGFIAVLLFVRMLFLTRNRGFAPGVGIGAVAAFCLSPMVLNQTFAVSGDAVVLLFAIALAGWLVFWSEVRRLDSAILVVLGIVACSTKPVMLPMGIGVLLAHYLYRRTSPQITDERSKGGGFVIACSCAWIVASIAVSAYDYMMLQTTYKAMTSVDPNTNGLFLLADYGRAWSILWGSVSQFLVLDYMATPIGWNNIVIKASTVESWKTILYVILGLDLLVALLFSLRGFATIQGFFSLKRIGIVLLHGMVVWSGILSFLLLTALALYLRWTPEGALGVVGLQRRYFLPFFIVGFAEILALCGFGLRSTEVPEQPSRPLTVTLGAFVGFLGISILGAQYVVSLYIDIMSRYQ